MTCWFANNIIIQFNGGGRSHKPCHGWGVINGQEIKAVGGQHPAIDPLLNYNDQEFT